MRHARAAPRRSCRGPPYAIGPPRSCARSARGPPRAARHNRSTDSARGPPARLEHCATIAPVLVQSRGNARPVARRSRGPPARLLASAESRGFLRIRPIASHSRLRCESLAVAMRSTRNTAC